MNNNPILIDESGLSFMLHEFLAGVLFGLKVGTTAPATEKLVAEIMKRVRQNKNPN